MANIINNNFNFYKLKPYRSEYWDFTLNKDMGQYSQNNFQTADENLITYIDFTDKSLFNDTFVNSYNSYKWSKAYSTDYVLENIGYTGFDNGLLYFERDKIRNEEFTVLYSQSQYKIHNDEAHLKVHFVTGSTLQYSYDYKIEEKSIKLNGGFLQGFFKTECGKYEVLPSSFSYNDVLAFEFVLKPCDMDNENKRFFRLNDVYPNNKGLFLYIGTRSENKWVYLYNKEEEEEVSYDDYIDDGGVDINKHKINAFNDMSIDREVFPNSHVKTNVEICDLFGEEYLDDELVCDCEFDYIENEIDISDFIYETHDNCFTIGEYEDYGDYNNPFLLFNRTCDGFNVKTKKDDSQIRYVWNRAINKKDDNLFLLMNRTSTGHTVSSLEEYYKNNREEYDIYSDLYENALGFRITEDGKIGYRYLIKNTEMANNMEIVEAYSKEGVVKYNEWNHIIVKIEFRGEKMLFKFYSNGNLVFISKFLPKLNLRQLDEIYEKQETVPFNISIGGGTQGLSETILPNYMLNPYHTFPLEKNFGGTFIGDIKTFKIYLGEMNYNEIFNNFQYELGKILN